MTPKYPGFLCRDYCGDVFHVYYLDPMGKDVSYPRWRVYAYYSQSYACTVLFDTEDEYLTFIDEKSKLCYPDYQSFSKDFSCSG